MIFSSYVRDPLAELLEAVRLGDYDRPIPACGRVLRLARNTRLVAETGYPGGLRPVVLSAGGKALIEGAGPPYSPLVLTAEGAAR